MKRKKHYVHVNVIKPVLVEVMAFDERDAQRLVFNMTAEEVLELADREGSVYDDSIDITDVLLDAEDDESLRDETEAKA